jgi:transposase
LRCSSCGTRRDVLGARNILAKARHFMEHHEPHPVMGG